MLGPQWFTVYTSPVRDIILKYNLNYHVYVDDTQLYITFKSSQEPADSCITTLEKCIQVIHSWMKTNFLKLNNEKTEFLLFGSRQQLSKVSLPFITIGDSQITPSSQARNLGVIFDLTMTLKPHISNIVCVSSFHIRNIGRIRKYLNRSAAEQIIHYVCHITFNNIAPIYISELVKVYTPSRNLHSSNTSLLKKPTSKWTWGDRSFPVTAPRLWNHLPTKLKSCQTITRFKLLLKTHLMSQFFKDDVL